jgi:Apea-like HEPN
MKQSNISEGSLVSYTIESYAVFYGVDRGILETNEFLEIHGYKFVRVDLEELEKTFSDLLLPPRDSKSIVQVQLGDSGLLVSEEFLKAIQNSRIFGFQSLIDNEVFLLKANRDYSQEVLNNRISSAMVDEISKIRNFSSNIVQQFRLFKSGEIGCSMSFLMRKETRFIFSTASSQRLTWRDTPIFSLTSSEAEALGKVFKLEFAGNKLTELALSNFNLAYDIADLQTKYVTLMTCLESLFNQSTEQITHTVSRHLSLIISSDESEFNTNYQRIKKLYKIRSEIVHGSNVKENLGSAIEDLQNIARKAINYCLTLQISKAELFSKLNAKGYG